MKNALITIVDRHFSDGDDYSCELTTAGQFEMSEKGCVIVYNEASEELADCVTSLKVEGSEKITMTRTGSYQTELIIEKDRRHNCFYQTPHGELIMGVYAKVIENKMTENGGTLRFSYTIDFNNVPAAENELLFTVVPKTEV